MLVDDVVLGLAGRVMIASLYLFQCFNGIHRFQSHSDRIRARDVPAPALVLACGLAMMFTGSIMVLLNVYAAFGAELLIIFTIVATVLYHNFWSTEDPRQRRGKRNNVVNNVAMVGGLLLVIAQG
jgi:putative oxidoreductase